MAASTSLTPEQLRLRASIAANTLWSLTEDRAAHTAPARQAFLGRFERVVDPDGTLTPEERARRAQHARKAYFQRLALASSKARAAKAGARRNGGGQGAA
ncbi:hypothetical protein GCM10010313_20390 [Streptomyces violarus]|uniref:Uncharacterized protein n=1 Tax=Streptomyces violarus TaxID=67380 RepID=A0A7W4ZN97_9ACTN|nr:hypothetical protein [Streptomyces violarus]GHD04285.1 hypothetical protein GCM10010313_20390 [Streptomyces violarus]